MDWVGYNLYRAIILLARPDPIKMGHLVFGSSSYRPLSSTSNFNYVHL